MKKTVQAPGYKLTVAALAGSILLASLGISAITITLPTLAAVFSASVQQVQWVVLAYLQGAWVICMEVVGYCFSVCRSSPCPRLSVLRHQAWAGWSQAG